MIRTLCLSLLFLVGCSLPERPLPTDVPIGTPVIIKADGREGVVISNYPSTKKPGQTEWLVKFENPNSSLGTRYTVQGFFHEELKAQP